jgi:hypothetical protein
MQISRKNKTTGPADAPGLTSAEIARRDLLTKEKTERAVGNVVSPDPNLASQLAEDPGLLPPSTGPPRLEDWRILQHGEDVWTDC